MKNLLALCIVLLLQNALNAQNCDNWMYVERGGSVKLGDIDVAGTELTVEAVFNRTIQLNNGLYYGSLVSKHSSGNNCNYSLLPNGCEITTSNGYKSTFQTCKLQLGETYHVAMVYNGSTLRFYRNGNLVSQVACKGAIKTNDLPATIGQLSENSNPENQFVGFINEVRIWKTARTPAELASYMNKNLPSPQTQSGLVAYYTFEKLENKQGDTRFNGTMKGNTEISLSNTECLLANDSCSARTAIAGGIVGSNCDESCYWRLNGNNIQDGNNIFGSVSNHDIRIFSNNKQRGIITANGFFGWSTANPTALFHLDLTNRDSLIPSSLRLENLAAKQGYTLVVDSAGYVYKDTLINTTLLFEKVNLLEAQNEDLKRRLSELEALMKPGGSSKDRITDYKLNTANGKATISYSVKQFTTGASIVVTDNNNVPLQTLKLVKGSGVVQFDQKTLKPGVYTFTLIVDGRKIDSKKITVQ